MYQTKTCILMRIKIMSTVPFILLLFVAIPCISSRISHYYVTPHPNTSCPVQPCLTLDQYVQDTDHYFTSNTTFVFLDGEHQLSAHLALRGVSNITLMGNTSSLPQVFSKIRCTSPVSINFNAVSEIKVSALAFASCGVDTSNNGAIHLADAQKISFTDCILHDNAFTALSAWQSSLTLNNVTIANNSQSALKIYSSTVNSICSTFRNNSGDQGGAAAIFNSYVNFTGSTVMESNSASYGGGMFATNHAIVNMDGNCSFIDNSASRYGGGVMAVVGVTMAFEGNYSFVNNSAREHGGGIFVFDTTVNMDGNYSFINNSASEYGGGILVTGTTVNMDGNYNFINNSARYGGGIYMQDNITMNYHRKYSFTNNSSSESGGGISANNHTTVNMDGNCSFIDNSASRFGGGIMAAVVITMSFEGNSSFINNSASEHGGGIFVFHTTVNMDGNCSFINNSAGGDGGGIYAYHHTIVSLNGNCIFIDNSASSHGGGIFVIYHTTVNMDGNCSFINNSARNGGGISIQDNITINLHGNYSFTDNFASEKGGGICAYNHNTVNMDGNCNIIDNSASYGGGIFATNHIAVNMDGNCSFIGNSASEQGGGIMAADGITMAFEGNSSFINNLASEQGGGIFVSDTTVNMDGNYSFINNSASYGGGIFVIDTTMNFHGNYSFTDNSASEDGGGICAYRNTTVDINGNCSIVNNSANSGGGIFAIYNHTTVLMDGNCIFINNSARLYGGGMSAFIHSTVNLKGNCSFINNSARNGGTIFAYHAKMNFDADCNFVNNLASTDGGGIWAAGGTTMNFDGYYNFINNSAGSSGGGIIVVTSTMNIYGVCAFTNNSATYGGGIALTNSVCYLFHQRGSRLNFTGNRAQRGGAIAVSDSPYELAQYCFTPASNTAIRDCFFHIQTVTYATNLNVSIIFTNNSALEAGDVVYGGTIDTCFSTPHQPVDTGELFDSLVPNITEDKLSAISSDPVKVCICNSIDLPDCGRKVSVTSYPGESFTVTAVAVGQRDGTVPAVIQSVFEKDSNASLRSDEILQYSNKTCTTLHYTVFSDDSSEQVNLYAEGACGPGLGQPLSVSVTLLPCPNGFELSPTTRACICERRLQQYTESCDINRQTISRDGHPEFWVGYDNATGDLILHPHCPFDYCKSVSVDFTLNNSDLQCNYNRSGLLCGSCRPGLSLVLGTSQCFKCSDAYLVLLIAFVLAGLFLAFFLLICRLTVAVGTINGLIFYANIVAVNRSTFIPDNLNLYGRILNIFIAWLNLDLGIETCFYSDMDAYTKTWLQFAFPFYIWALVGLIIIGSRYSPIVARTLGTNPVAVLATLFLLSYTKILRTIIAVIAFTNFQFPNDAQTVWLYDGNITYFSGRHIPLFIAAIAVFLALFLPYTLLLLIGQFLQTKSNWKILSWVNSPRLKSLMDAYHGPYRNESRYWPGLLLMVRVILLLTFSLNTLHYPSVNLLAISVCILGLQTIELLIRGIYKNWCLKALESFYILNLGIFAAATFYVQATAGSQAAVAYTSLSAAFVVFIGIVIYHMYIQLRDIWRRRQRRLRALLADNDIDEAAQEIQVPSQVELERVVSDETRALVPTTVVAVSRHECERETLIFDASL